MNLVLMSGTDLWLNSRMAQIMQWLPAILGNYIDQTRVQETINEPDEMLL